ncbi:SIR2 family protein [Aeromonas tecta]|uniref:SIR2 family protein n=1 Tax=Aeromonas tecta TaxID=324617 RepID=UPI0009FAFC8B|nr:SIR2 family protein [Aeromonas tecta]
MGDAIRVKDAILPLLESLQVYHQYQQENTILDSDEYGYSVCLQREGEYDGVSIARPSLALFHGDRVLYEQECKRLRKELLDGLLASDLFPRNRNNYQDLLSAIKANKITPFIGAGSSISAGCQSWGSYLRNKAKEVGLSEHEITPMLSSSQYEELLDLIITQPKGSSFDFYFQQDFEYADPEKSFSWLLPELFTGCVITTNFDRVIEECYAKQGVQFKEKCEGLNNPSNFIKAMTRGDHYLLKLHGNFDRPDFRVFKKSEYQAAYSNLHGDDVDMKSPIPKLLSHIYSSHSLLFLGCSLSVDRTIKVFENILKNKELKPKIADHYAIIEKPDNEQEFNTLEVMLQSCNIKPIWYEFGHHVKIPDILTSAINQLKYDV